VETTQITLGAWNSKQGRCPHCGAVVGRFEVIWTLPARTNDADVTGVDRVVQCGVCHKQSRFTVTV
jgi:hypothetical protein